MLTLLAYTPDERWAFARDGGRVVLVRPPFQNDVAASDAEVERAVTVLGFIALERDFATRRALLDFLSDESVRVWRERTPPKDLDSLRRDLLAVLTATDLDEHIAHAQKKVDAGKLDEAQTSLSRLLTAAALTPLHRAAIAATQERAQSARRAQEEQRKQALRSVATARFKHAAGAPLPGRAGGADSTTLLPAA
jgi:hypothetical protein